MANTLFELVGEDDDMSPRRTMELLWADAVAHLPQTDGEVFLPRNVVDDVLDMDLLMDMATRLASMLNKKVDIVLDESIDAYRMFPKHIAAENDEDVWVESHGLELDDHRRISKSIYNAGNSVKLPVRPAKVPRPPNCFILYRQANHHLVKDANPGVSNNEISRILGARWNNESSEIREQFTRLADDLKREHAIKHPDYQYAPRRPSERKRRTPRTRASCLPVAQEDSNYVDVDDQLMTIDDKFMSELHSNGYLFGPNGVEPVSAPFTNEECLEMSNELLSGNILASLPYVPMF
ncbi:High mobility group superfamily [Penicillium psychrosexuale]|uniref:High mobility group superfamily n=1 Tax=Penicillium psychrosexuale TaxID=1002107 RepID=UPI0025452B81|nr:High mobility group superfamily [Penicillium psychrosexuale]KAJ5801336.1 High mobility group superfamily [Penicillium psychrosexuale]